MPALGGHSWKFFYHEDGKMVPPGGDSLFFMDISNMVMVCRVCWFLVESRLAQVLSSCQGVRPIWDSPLSASVHSDHNSVSV